MQDFFLIKKLYYRKLHINSVDSDRLISLIANIKFKVGTLEMCSEAICAKNTELPNVVSSGGYSLTLIQCKPFKGTMSRSKMHIENIMLLQHRTVGTT